MTEPTSGDPPRGWWAKFNAGFLGDRNRYLPDLYGMKAEDLARLMTARMTQNS